MKNKCLALLLAGSMIFANHGVVYAGQIVPSVEEAACVETDGKTENDDTPYFGNGYFDIEVEQPEEEEQVDRSKEESLIKSSTCPAKYRSDNVDTDEDGEGDTGYLPALRDQGIYNTCWAFSTIGACEASLIKKKIASSTIDLSEKHLAYYLYNKPSTVGDMMGNTIGDYNRISGLYYNAGGNNYYAMWHLASGAGLVSESKSNAYSYSTITNTALMENTSSDIYGQDDYLLQNAYVIPFYKGYSNEEALAEVKEYIMEYGAVAASYYEVQSNAEAYDSGAAGKDNSDEGCYYHPSATRTNHGIQLVGWDDNYSKDNFATTPAGDGAWLVKNSWGEEDDELAQHGYFWLSYYDSGLNSANSRVFVFDCDKADQYDHIYQYDGASSVKFSSRIKEAANVFQASSQSEYEMIEAVSIGIESSASYSLEIYVYDSDETASDFTNTDPVIVQDGVIPCDGYHTITLDHPVYVAKDQKFAVLFKFDSSVYLYADKATSGTYSCYTTQETGQSLYKTETDENWVDSAEKSEANRIKAFTSDCTGIPIDRVVLDESTLTLNKGETKTLTATVFPSNTSENKEVTWESSDISVATVTSEGVVTAVGAGSTTLTASCGEKRAICTLTVEVPVESVVLNKTTLTLGKESSELLTATVLPEDTTDNAVVTWISSDETVATVSENGLVSTKDVGIASITAKCGDVETSCEVFVISENAESVLYSGKTDDASWMIDSDGLLLICGEGDFVSGEWLSHTEDIKKAKISGQNITSMHSLFGGCSNLTEVDLTAVDTSQVTDMSDLFSGCDNLQKIIMPKDILADVSFYQPAGYAWMDESGTTCTKATTGLSVPMIYTRISSDSSYIESIALKPETVSLHKGETITLDAVITASQTVENPKLTWNSNQESIATVDNGVVTAVEYGEATITVITENLKTAECIVKVTDVIQQEQEITGTDSYTKMVGDEAFLLDSKLTQGDGSLSYISDNEEVVTVSQTGEVTIVGEGEAAITVTAAETEEYKECTFIITIAVNKNTGSDDKLSVTSPETSSDSITTWDCVYFGEYWQNDTNGDGKADEKDEKQPIKWRVLSVNGEDAFLISDVALDCKQYNVEWSDQGLRDYITWETCTLRSWLNGYGSDSNKCKIDYSNSNFIDNAFSSVEQSYIKTASVVNNDHPEWGTEGGNDTQDKIFLLSIEEAYMSDYGFNDNIDRYTKCSDYASQNGAYRHTSDDMEYVDNCYWWLRSPGYFSNDAATINVFGFKDDLGCSVDVSDGAIRPVLHLDLSDGNVWEYAGTVSSYNADEHEHTGGTATCTQKAICVICGKEYGELSAHKENKGIITKEATKEAKGIIEYSCEVCGKVLRTEEYSVNVSNDIGTTEQNNTANQAVVSVVSANEQDTVVKGTIVTDKMLKYQVTMKEDNKYEIACVGTENKKAKTVTIPTSIVIGGITYKVTSIANGAFKNNKKLTTVVIGKNVTTIGKEAFKGCSKLKTITINSNVLKKVGKNALKGINTKASIKVPKKKKTTYQKLLKGKGQSKSVKIK